MSMPNPQIKSISASSIDNALRDNLKQYLIGNLRLPQDLQHIPSNSIEFGIARFKAAGYESPHYHSRASEYQYVLDGYCEFIDIATHIVYKFSKGDFFVIESGIAYALKAAAGTEIIFAKLPPGNDKHLVAPDEFIRQWLLLPITASLI